MASYTIELWELIEHQGSAWMQNYELFDEAHRAHLNQMIVDQYANREIAHETYMLFFTAFRLHMNKNMPLFNKLYESEKLEFDHAVTMKLETTNDANTKSLTKSDGTAKSVESASGDSETNTEVDTKGLNVGYSFPQTRLDDRKDYATSAGDSEGETNTASTGTESSTRNTDGEDNRITENEATDKGKSVTVGYQGIPADLIAAFRSTAIRIDEMLVNSLEPLFMGVWGTATRRIERL